MSRWYDHQIEELNRLIAAGERGIPKIPAGPDTRHAIYPPDYRSKTPPPWAASDRKAANEAKEDECREELARLVFDLTTLASDWERNAQHAEWSTPLFDCADSLRSVLRRHGVMR